MNWMRMATPFRWPDFDFSLPWSVFQWPELDFSYFVPTRWNLQRSFTRLLDFTVDELLWTFVVVLESFVLVSMLCYFFVFCGCTL